MHCDCLILLGTKRRGESQYTRKEKNRIRKYKKLHRAWTDVRDTIFARPYSSDAMRDMGRKNKLQHRVGTRPMAPSGCCKYREEYEKDALAL